MLLADLGKPGGKAVVPTRLRGTEWSGHERTGPSWSAPPRWTEAAWGRRRAWRRVVQAVASSSLQRVDGGEVHLEDLRDRPLHSTWGNDSTQPMSVWGPETGASCEWSTQPDCHPFCGVQSGRCSRGRLVWGPVSARAASPTDRPSGRAAELNARRGGVELE